MKVFTWSHALDDRLPVGNIPSIYRGSADFNLRSRFSAPGSYQLLSARKDVRKVVTGGWILDSIVLPQTSTPFSVVTGRDADGNGAGCNSCNHPNVGPELTKITGFSRAQHEGGIFGPNSSANPAVGITEGNAGRNRFRKLAY